MLDFTSALYLGLHHASWSLRPWAQLTTGQPAALASPPRAREVAQRLAALIGCERATLGPSTLHLSWDLFGMLASGGLAIYMDAGVYPIARWGVERAAARGVPVRTFPHHDADALRSQLKQERQRRWRPLVVTDGLCPVCGGPAPIAEYLESVQSFGGYLIMDDTQAMGILGHSPGPGAPYGRGGGGMLRWSNMKDPGLLVVSSLAKGFGVSVAVLAGSDPMVRRFESESETRIHTSPPSVAVIHAAEHALNVNDEQGDAIRLRLAQRVIQFRQGLREAGFVAKGGYCPVQTLAPLPSLDAPTLHERLLRLGVRTVLHRARVGSGARLSFLITARHRPGEIGQAVATLARAAGATRTHHRHRNPPCAAARHEP